MTWLKTLLLLTGLTVLTVMIGHAIGGTVGMLIAFGLALVMNGLAYWFSDAVALRMAGARELREWEAPQLYSLVRELAIVAGLPEPRLYIIDSPSPNAFATGRDPAHGAVAVTTGLLRLLSEAELAGVLAHELAHIKNRDTLIATIAATLAGALTMLADIGQWSLIVGGLGSREEDDQPANPLAILLMLLVAPIAALLLQFAISRQREYAADALGARIVGDPWPLARALDKLERAAWHRPMIEANPALASLYIVNPFAGAGLVNLFSTHPPVAERIERLLALARRPASLWTAA